MQELLFTVPLFPLIGAALNGFLGYRIPKRGVTVIAVLGSGLAFAAAVLVFIGMVSQDAGHRFFEQRLFPWIVSGSLTIDAGLQMDPLAGLMMLIVTGVGFLIHVYSTSYMHEEYGYPRYFAFLNLFLFAMLVLVLGNSYLMMFIGWEGVGLCSYLLIGYYYEKKSAGDAGKKAFIMNRIGDFGFILATMLLFVTFGTLRYSDVGSLAVGNLGTDEATATAITLLLFLGAVGKSAQIPLYTWLPDAMEGPTPVSALIHAATMVTAGIYMVARSSALFVLAPTTLTVVAAIGASTAIFAATIALVQTDIKKVLAYSTVSQLGYMFLACGVGAFSAAIFHVMTHAFFKACLFLGSGSVIHAVHGAADPQDMRQMGGLKKWMPVTYGTFLVSTLAIAGIFPFAGFFSKDEILFQTFVGGHKALWVVGATAALLTAFYMFRLLYLTFHGEFRGDHHVKEHVHESPFPMTMPLVVLAVLATLAGALGLPAVMGHNVVHEFLSPVLATIGGAGALHGSGHSQVDTVGHSGAMSHEILEWTLMGVSLGIAILGIVAARFLYRGSSLPEKMARWLSPLYKTLYNKYYVDEIYDVLFVRPIRLLSEKVLWAGIDVRVIDGFVNSLASSAAFLGDKARWIQNGSVRRYAFVMLLGTITIVVYYIVQ